MTQPVNLAAVRIRMGTQAFYIPASQVRNCSRVTHVSPTIPRFSQWLGIADEPHEGSHLHFLFRQAASIPAGTYGGNWRMSCSPATSFLRCLRYWLTAVACPRCERWWVARHSARC